MQLILKTDNAIKVAEVIALAKKLNISVETKDESVASALEQQLLIAQLTLGSDDKRNGLSSSLAGSIDKNTAAELNTELENMRNEW